MAITDRFVFLQKQKKQNGRVALHWHGKIRRAVHTLINRP